MNIPPNKGIATVLGSVLFKKYNPFGKKDNVNKLQRADCIDAINAKIHATTIINNIIDTKIPPKL